ncbi:hypothetical protein GWK47_015404 [Chionoecetes opilio]|uniref:Uncharacterized protein n=1 Tax=Chionoecetes opilio TaxID=41210 RepID=A0A8J5CIC2_CHIOP|nr:hypothetical protein GWK47_015404 [Chionoecetes opilio]
MRFRHGHADAFDPTRWRGSGFPAGPARPGGPRFISKGAGQSLGRRERRGGAPACKAVELTGACHDCPAQIIGLGVQGTKKITVVFGTGGRGFVSQRRNIPSTACSPKRRPTPSDARLSPPPCVGPQRISGRPRSLSFHRCPPGAPHATPPCSTVRGPRGARGRRWLRDQGGDDRGNCRRCRSSYRGGKLARGVAGEGIAERLPLLVSGDGIQKLLMVPQKKSGGDGRADRAGGLRALRRRGPRHNIIGSLRHNSQQYRTKEAGGCVHIMKHVKKGICSPSLSGPHVPASGGRSITVCFGPSSGPEIQLFKRFLNGGPLRTRCRPNRSTTPSGAPKKKIIAPARVVKEKQPRDGFSYPTVGGEVLGEHPGNPGAYHPARWMAKVIYTLKIPSSPRGFAHPNTRRGSDRFTTFFVTSTWNVDVRPMLDLGPVTDLAPLKAPPPIATRGSGGLGKVWPRECGRLRGARRPSPSSTRRRGRGEAGHAAPAAGLGEKNPPPAPPGVALDAVEQAPASFSTTNPRGASSPPSGPVRFPQRRSGEWAGRGITTARRRAVTYGGNDLREGGLPSQRFCGGHHARRGKATQTFCRHGAHPGGFYRGGNRRRTMGRRRHNREPPSTA